ncbi:MAG: zinc ribbon domain-containing protein [Clostridia bacterium]|nr:zinc ribbon domain-containing protein [Clostridia bacterium]
MKAFVCPHCGADIRYDIEKEAMTCGHCDSVIRREEYQEYLDRNNLYVTNELVCSQCGAAVLSYDDTISTFCSYCGSPVAFTRRIVEDSRPDGIVPFSVTKEQAAALYEEKLKNSGFARPWLFSGTKEKLVGIYVPYYVYETASAGHVRTKGTSRTSSGSYTTVREYEMEFDLEANYDGTRFDAAEAFPDSMSETVDTFNPDGAKPFETSYLAGFYADGGNVSEEAYSGVVKGLVRNDIRGSGIKYGGISVDLGNVDPPIELQTKKLLLPVWLNTKRKGDRVTYSAINGQNGDVAAEIPADPFKYVRISVITAAAVSLLLNIFLTLKPDVFLLISEIILLIFGIIQRKYASDVYIREQNLDDIGRIGIREFAKTASPAGHRPHSIFRKAGKTVWKFSVPLSVRLRGWWKTLLGLIAGAAVLLSGTVSDPVYYGAGVFSMILSVWSDFDLIRQQNALSSRDIPVFTMKRGGDGND